ncbi:hypothetical protein CLM85_03775 [Streptomyces albidoflavus]|nr:hypothetical protein CLM81_02240 [Streptomyces albidoflavus]PAX89167.1 hypothetical protein CLM82_22620 [Streptomyces albidoflavus]PBO18307.1 hypothetical protein CLM83_13040 [Streptomyces albidoflavus]PBO25525.1 hypothetical protein CLM85_03775 [Streptomyces albidoflavus]PBO27632.1 hypothetical protein CLM84_24645 [Streptomyces albidoflavus]
MLVAVPQSGLIRCASRPQMSATVFACSQDACRSPERYRETSEGSTCIFAARARCWTPASACMRLRAHAWRWIGVRSRFLGVFFAVVASSGGWAAISARSGRHRCARAVSTLPGGYFLHTLSSVRPRTGARTANGLPSERWATTSAETPSSARRASSVKSAS